MNEYAGLLEDEIFKSGEQQGRLKTALTILTDMLIELNSIEIFYQKPGSKSLSPPEINDLRKKLEAVKQLLHVTIEIEQ